MSLWKNYCVLTSCRMEIYMLVSEKGGFCWLMLPMMGKGSAGLAPMSAPWCSPNQTKQSHYSHVPSARLRHRNKTDGRPCPCLSRGLAQIGSLASIISFTKHTRNDTPFLYVYMWILKKFLFLQVTNKSLVNCKCLCVYNLISRPGTNNNY
jgi:hypothetical protein